VEVRWNQGVFNLISLMDHKEGRKDRGAAFQAESMGTGRHILYMHFKVTNNYRTCQRWIDQCGGGSDVVSILDPTFMNTLLDVTSDEQRSQCTDSPPY
jgi:nicotinic acid phosphoribosyltransferase